MPRSHVQANLYEREYRISGREALLESSSQAIRQVLNAERTTPAQRAEALALQGCNLKTVWRARLAAAADPPPARQQALDVRALKSYESYRDAFHFDLNAFYPGLAALQMGHILLLLAALPGWRKLFNGNKLAADRARQDLENDLPALAHVVAASFTRARQQLPEPERIWADIEGADLLFLTLPDEELQVDHSVLVQAFRNAIPLNKQFAWDAASGQLILFARLGHRAEPAQAVIQAFERPPDSPRSARSEHLVLFSGHLIDAAGAPPRFPAAAEAQARRRIAERLSALKQASGEGEQINVLASAAPGADILVHEVCAELDVPSRLCLPMPPDDVAHLIFADAGPWRTRFNAVVKTHPNGLLQLADEADLPHWLQGRTSIVPWERGNRWVMQMAQTWGAQRVTLLVLWDGQDDGRMGGTAHMVRMARALGRFELDIIDSRQLLA